MKEKNLQILASCGSIVGLTVGMVTVAQALTFGCSLNGPYRTIYESQMTYAQVTCSLIKQPQLTVRDVSLSTATQILLFGLFAFFSIVAFRELGLLLFSGLKNSSLCSMLDRHKVRLPWITLMLFACALAELILFAAFEGEHKSPYFCSPPGALSSLPVLYGMSDLVASLNVGLVLVVLSFCYLLGAIHNNKATFLHASLMAFFIFIALVAAAAAATPGHKDISC